MAKPILISISPNAGKSDILLAIKTIFQPRSLKTGRCTTQLSARLLKLLNQKYIWLFNAGRNALEVGLKTIKLKSTDEVLCQAFTCVAVPNAIKWVGAKPIFVDTNKNGFNLDPTDLLKKITKNSKAIIIQHTFGNPDDLISIKKICQKHNLILIEDCAHTLGVKYHGKPIGSFGDLTILSFGRDKVISSVFGGALLTSNKNIQKNIDNIYKTLKYPSQFWTLKQLFHPIIMALAKPFYFSIGKYLIFLYQKSGLLSWPVTRKEKTCQISLPPQKLPNGLASLALHQLKHLKSINQTRLNTVHSYQSKFQVRYLESLPLLRYPLLVNNPEKLINQAKKAHILLGDWYRPVIAPKGVNLSSVGYKHGSCPNAENSSKNIINLPTNLTPKDADRVIKLVSSYVRS